MELTLVTFRDVFQWAVRHQPALYQERSAVVRLSPQDMKELGGREGSRLRLSNASGEVVVQAKADPRLPRGYAFMPVSPYANLLSGYQPERDRLPDFKHIQVDAQPTEVAITPLSQVLPAPRAEDQALERR